MKWLAWLFKSKPAPVRVVYRYHWMSLRTGQRGTKEVMCYTKEEFHESLARWNRINRNWKYWEAS